MKKADVSVPLYRHNKRPAWGMALLAWERGQKRGYLFEDGVLRVMAQPYYHLMTLDQVDQTELSAAFRQQISQMSMVKADGLLDPKRGASALFSVEEQAQLLMGQFPGGFAADAWRQHHRGDGAKKHLKRHRTAAIAKAGKVLDAERVAGAVLEHRHEGLWQEICDMLQSTDLVPLREVKALKQKLPSANRNLTVALAALLHAEPSAEEQDSSGKRFSAFVNELQAVLGSRPSWPLVTSFLALYAPDKHVCVHPSSLRQQSKWMGGKVLRSKKPNLVDYEGALATSKKLFDNLTELGLAPTDLLDVYDFVRTLTTPSAKKRLEALRQSDLRQLGATREQRPEKPAKSSTNAAGSDASSTETDRGEQEAA